MTKKFVIDAGHGGKDAGAVNGDLYEKDVALKVAKLLGEELEKRGHKVVYTHVDDTFIELSDRAKISNNSNADYFVSIHCNSADDKTAEGVETWYYKESTSGKALAQSVQNELAKIDGVKDRGIKGGEFYVLKYTKAPSILIELGFISHEAEKKLLFKEFYQRDLCDKIITGITKHVG